MLILDSYHVLCHVDGEIKDTFGFLKPPRKACNVIWALRQRCVVVSSVTWSKRQCISRLRDLPETEMQVQPTHYLWLAVITWLPKRWSWTGETTTQHWQQVDMALQALIASTTDKVSTIFLDDKCLVGGLGIDSALLLFKPVNLPDMETQYRITYWLWTKIYIWSKR